MLFVVVWGWICYFMLIYFYQKTVCMTMKMTVTVHQSVLQFVKTVFMNKYKNATQITAWRHGFRCDHTDQSDAI